MDLYELGAAIIKNATIVRALSIQPLGDYYQQRLPGFWKHKHTHTAQAPTTPSESGQCIAYEYVEGHLRRSVAFCQYSPEEEADYYGGADHSPLPPITETGI